MSTDI